MNSFRTYGKPPFRVAVIHGGPGAPGEMAPVARELARGCGVLEPLQTRSTIEGQVAELRGVLEHHATCPVTLIGFSWGAILSFIYTSRHPHSVKKLILVGSAVFEGQFAADIAKTRIERLSADDRRLLLMMNSQPNDGAGIQTDQAFAELGRLFSRTDAFDPLSLPDEVVTYQHEIFRTVWNEAEDLRHNGKLLAYGKEITCPVVAVHGDYDPHPADGVRIPLSRVLGDFRFILLRQCGHRPWIEREARGRFFEILHGELGC